jgi:peptide/nickel transport system permease protein
MTASTLSRDAPRCAADTFTTTAPQKSPNLAALAWRRFKRDRLALAALGALTALGLMALLATPLSTYITGFEPDKVQPLFALKPPGFQRAAQPTHWLGTDDLGRDVLTRIMFGAQVSLFISVLTVALTLTIGTLSGALAGYFGGVTDTLISRCIEILLSVPGLFLLLLVSAVFRPPWWGLALIIASVGWMGVARLVRNEFLSLRARFRVGGAHDWLFECAHHLSSHLAQRRLAAHRRGDLANRRRDFTGDRPLVLGFWRATAHAVVGQHAHQRATLH